DVIEAVEQAHIAHAQGSAGQPPRATVALAGTKNAILPMTATLPTGPAAGIKLLSIFPDNPNQGLPALSAVVVLVDATNGGCSALVEASLLTAYRTAAASAVATRSLARVDSTVLGLIGAGLEARTHLESMRCVRPITKVLVWSRSRSTSARFADEVSPTDVK